MKNNIEIEGNLTKDPELKQLPSGTYLVTFSIAYNKSYKSNNEWKKETYFFECEAWSDLSKVIYENFSKGNFISIKGSLKQNRWKDKTGRLASMIKIVVFEASEQQNLIKKEEQKENLDDVPFV